MSAVHWWPLLITAIGVLIGVALVLSSPEMRSGYVPSGAVGLTPVAVYSDPSERTASERAVEIRLYQFPNGDRCYVRDGGELRCIGAGDGR